MSKFAESLGQWEVTSHRCQIMHCHCRTTFRLLKCVYCTGTLFCFVDRRQQPSRKLDRRDKDNEEWERQIIDLGLIWVQSVCGAWWERKLSRGGECQLQCDLASSPNYDDYIVLGFLRWLFDFGNEKSAIQAAEAVRTYFTVVNGASAGCRI